MKLIDLLSLTNENTNVNVYDLEGNLISLYDGKNSIEEEYNEIEIHNIKVNNDMLEITIYVED